MREIDTTAEFRIVSRLTELQRTTNGAYQDFLVEYVLAGGVRTLRVTAVGEADCNEMASHVGEVRKAMLDMRTKKGKGQYENKLFTNIYIRLV